MKPARLGALLVVVLFCAPLFVGLGRGDLIGDEAGHSFSVDRILETGDWLVPKSSPHEDAAFLEKPPLKFWIVAAGIRAGLLPHNEFGLRFWDALFGGLAFLYVFAIGRRLAGAVCGVVAVLTLFAFWPLVFDHGLRTNNMEAALLLCYCGGVYHFLEAFSESGSTTAHAVSVALYFTLGFMTKFVAAIFLPIVLAVCVLIVRDYRQRLVRNWMSWAVAKILAIALIAPWFVFASIRFGAGFWRVILGEQVVTRMSTYLVADHVQPWDFYWVTIYKGFSYAGAFALVAGGLLLLLIQTVRRRWPEGLVVLVWAAGPLALISFGSSKLIHYMYPFLPPFALAAGYLAAMIVMLAPAPLERVRGPRILLAAAAVLLAAVAVATAVNGSISITIGGRVLLRNAALFRPLVAAVVAAGLAVGSRRSIRLAAGCLALLFLPVPAYAENLTRLQSGKAYLRDMRDCLVQAEAQPGSVQGLYVDITDAEMQHSTYYYFRRVMPWTRGSDSTAADLRQNFAAGIPLLLSIRHDADLPAPGVILPARYTLEGYQVNDADSPRVVLPPRYAACEPAPHPAIGFRLVAR